MFKYEINYYIFMFFNLQDTKNCFRKKMECGSIV